MPDAISAGGARKGKCGRTLGYIGGYGRACPFTCVWKTVEGLAAPGAAFIPLKFKHGEAFQFDWSTEYTFVGGLRRRVELAHTKMCASRAFWLGSICCPSSIIESGW